MCRPTIIIEIQMTAWKMLMYTLDYHCHTYIHPVYSYYHTEWYTGAFKVLFLVLYTETANFLYQTHTQTHTHTHTHTHIHTHTHTAHLRQLSEEGWPLAHSPCPHHNLHTLTVPEDTLSFACLFCVCTSAKGYPHQNLERRGLEDYGGVFVLSDCRAKGGMASN